MYLRWAIVNNIVHCLWPFFWLNRPSQYTYSCLDIKQLWPAIIICYWIRMTEWKVFDFLFLTHWCEVSAILYLIVIFRCAPCRLLAILEWCVRVFIRREWLLGRLHTSVSLPINLIIHHINGLILRMHTWISLYIYICIKHISFGYCSFSSIFFTSIRLLHVTNKNTIIYLEPENLSTSWWKFAGQT